MNELKTARIVNLISGKVFLIEYYGCGHPDIKHNVSFWLDKSQDERLIVSLINCAIRFDYDLEDKGKNCKMITEIK